MRHSTASLFVTAALALSNPVVATDIDNASIASSLTYAYGNEAAASIQGELEIEPART